ncbi:MAG: CDP-diacylglycerol O-phosphatidyltransferase [Alphaproteobacteria bacterium]|nr:CDP-diacylglycerol O-phosphatidyltransferase [Alphaproteobacteria bacterium]
MDTQQQDDKPQKDAPAKTKKRRRPRKLPFHKMVPNMITLTAMSAGMTSIKFAIADRWQAAALAIVVAAAMDAFDGAAARLLKAQSKLGAELDSLSDFICFGVAPALVVYLWCLQAGGKWGWPVALIFAVAVALRLARFNISTEENDPNDPLSKYFTGVPSPLGAALGILPMVVCFQLDKGGGMEGSLRTALASPYFIAPWMLVVAGLMVSHLPTFSTKQMRIPYKGRLFALAAFAILLAGLINDPFLTLSILGIGYLFSLPFGWRHYARKKKALEAGITEEDDLDDDDAEPGAELEEDA